MLLWENLTRKEKEIFASKYGLSCVGEMELTDDSELEKIPEIAWQAMELKRDLAKEAIVISEKIVKRENVIKKKKKVCRKS